MVHDCQDPDRVCVDRVKNAVGEPKEKPTSQPRSNLEARIRIFKDAEE